MENMVCNVKDIDAADRQALEHVIGQRLGEDQQLVISVLNVPVPQGQPTSTFPTALPAWCNVYESLTDDDVTEIERTALTRANLSRDSE